MLSIISSQHYLNESIVAEKMKGGRFLIHISPPFIHRGHVKAVLLDGHHSLEAAKRLGQLPHVDVVDDEDCSGLELIYQGDIDWFLEWSKGDSDYYEIFTLDGEYHPVNS